MVAWSRPPSMERCQARVRTTRLQASISQRSAAAAGLVCPFGVARPGGGYGAAGARREVRADRADRRRFLRWAADAFCGVAGADLPPAVVRALASGHRALERVAAVARPDVE